MTDISALRQIGFEVSLIGRGIMPYHLESETYGDLTIVKPIRNSEFDKLIEEWKELNK